MDNVQNCDSYIHIPSSQTCTSQSRFPIKIQQTKNRQTPWPLVRERTIPNERPPLVDEI
jgi:hypothetical protein